MVDTRPVSFNICFNELELGSECSLSNQKDATILASTPGGCAAIQRKGDSMEKYTERNLMEFSKEKC